jgi:2,3-dihydroxybenzoate decarboxylase
MKGKITLEEHVSTEENNKLWDLEFEAARHGRDYMANVERRLSDSEQRLEEMDKFGIETMILSLTTPGAQSILDRRQAVDFAKLTNDLITEKFVAPHKGRFYTLATVALQNPRAAADELERAVKDLGMKGALINGYTNVGSKEKDEYLDAETVWEFWDRVAELDVPVYIHPRDTLPPQQQIYEGYPSLIGSPWSFGLETATHAARLMLSGLFDKYPSLTVILGHLGEGLAQLLPRMEWRLHITREGIHPPKAKRKVSEYFRQNFCVTTSGHFHTKSMLNCISEIGVDRVMFSMDYPYEDMESAVTWFDSALISDNDRNKIGRENAKRLFRLT